MVSQHADTLTVNEYSLKKEITLWHTCQKKATKTSWPNSTGWRPWSVRRLRLPLRDNGDLSENSEYEAAKEAQAHLEDKINQLKRTIASAKIVDTSRLSSDAVQILSKVELTNLATNQKMYYTIVSEQEANLREGKISITTPIAQGLLNKKVGDVAEIKVPRGVIKLRIESISI